MCCYQPLLLVLVCLVTAGHGGQIIVPPLYSPCEFPSPVFTHPNMFRLECLTVPKLPFICDLHHQLAHVSVAGIQKAYERYRSFFSIHGNSTIAIVIVKQLEAPTSVQTVYDQSKYRCLFDNDCTSVGTDLVNSFVNSVKIFYKIYAWKVYERWFAKDEKCTEANVMALVVLDGLVNDPRKIPHVRLHTGDPRLRISLGNIQSEANNALVQGWPLQQMVESLVDDIGYAMKELHDLNGEQRDHSVPKWAQRVIALCVFLVVFALFVEWWIVRRKLGVQKSGAGIKIASGKSKTHLMF